MPTPSHGSSAASPEVEFDLLREDFLAKFEEVYVRLNSLEANMERLTEGHDIVFSAVDPIDAEWANEATSNVKPLETEPESYQRSQWLQDQDVKEDEDQQGEIHFAESAWTYPVVIGLAKMGPADIAFAVLLLVVNLCVQAGFSGIILTPDFMGQPFEHQIVYAEEWRRSVAHDHKYADLADISLVSRVCNGDGALILSNRQATLIEHINSYMGLADDVFQPGFFQPGILLCVLCIALWCLCVYKELRGIFLSFEAMRQIPRSSKTQLLDHRQLTGLSTARYKVLKLIYALRTAIALLLLVSGIRWLARTTSITELMLNAVALNAILDVDEFLFAALTPMSIHLAIQKLEAVKVKYTQRRNKVESLLLFLLLAITFIVPYFLYLQPLAQTMEKVKQQLCGGNRTFVVAQNPEAQTIFAYVTENGRSNNLSVSELAVHDHAFSDAVDPKYLAFIPPVAFPTEIKRSMESEAADFPFCIEVDYMTEGGIWFQDPVVGGLVNPRFHTAAAMVGRIDVSECRELADLCYRPEARLLRMVCGATCNCTDPYTNAWWKVPATGCQPTCLSLATDQLKLPGSCKDQPSNRAWNETWDTYIPAMKFVIGPDVEQTSAIALIHEMIDAMKANGCKQLQNESMKYMIASSNTWCAGDPVLLRPLAWTCPESCGCTSPEAMANPPTYCPQSCFT